MKTLPSLFKKSWLQLIVFVMIIFLMKPVSAQVVIIGQTFSSYTIIHPYTGNQPVYSIHLYGSIQLYSDSSLVRVVVVDSYGIHLLLYESYPLITDTNSFSILGGCEETCFLEGIIPDSIRVDIISAFCTIDSLKLDTNYIPNASDLQAQAKLNNDSTKINTMNNRIKEEHMYWRAGRTKTYNLPFLIKEQLYGQKFNNEGYDFYKGGIFRKNSDKALIYENSSLVDNFDWRYRHGASDQGSPYYNSGGIGWFTSIKNQVVDTMINNQPVIVAAQTCYVFSPVAAVEARHNLVYNLHPDYPDIDISEMDVWRCPEGSGVLYNQGDTQLKSFDKLKTNNYKVEESCFPYTYHNVSNNAHCYWKCNDPDLKLCYIENYLHYFGNHNEDEVKQFLIENGPYSVRIKHFPSYPVNHYMVLSGYSIVKEGDTVYKGGLNDPDIVIESGSSIINTGYWDFKNSWGGNLFEHIQNTSSFWTNFDYTDIYVPTGLVYWYGHNNSEMRCTDEDGDGYYWWGVNLSPQLCNCPASVKEDQRDCDDNDVFCGPYATAGFNPMNQPLYSCLPNTCETSTIPYKIFPPGETWTTAQGDKHINQNIIITAGSTLTINCQVFFTPGAKIIIQAGGILNLSGTQLNPARLASGCGELWGGIEVQGYPLQPQNGFTQGSVVIASGIIENANCGIKTFNAGALPDGGGGITIQEGTPSGGIIQATGATFRNNVTDVEFLPYRHFTTSKPDPNLSYFKACIFETTQELLNGGSPLQHMKAFGINTLVIKGCTFRNSRDFQVPPSQRGKGIYSFNSQVVFDTLHRINGIIVNLPCAFDSLYYGVYAINSGQGPYSLRVAKCRLRDNSRGVYASGFTQLDMVTVDSSEFSCSLTGTFDDIYMLYLNNCTGYKVHQNYLTGATNANFDQYGVIVNNSGHDNNYIYDNFFEKLTYGLQGLNINRNSDWMIGDGKVPLFVPTGLRFICNKMQDITYEDAPGCTNDFLINENLTNWNSLPGIAYNQRNAANYSNPTQEPAGNVFTKSHSTGNPSDYDINISTSVGKILYMHHLYSQPSWLKVRPDDISNEDWVNYNAFTLEDFKEPESCPDEFFPEGDRTELRSALGQANEKVDSLITLLQLFVDAGSTDTLKSTVDNSMQYQSNDVYQDLIGASPYLSDSVVKAAIEKDEVLPNAMIQDIMVANPQSAKSEDLLNSLDQRIEPIPDSMWVEILQGKDTIGAMERLVDELSGWIQRRDLYFNALAELFRTDAINSWATDSLVYLYLTDNRLSSKYLLMNYYLNISDFSSANNVLHNIPYDFDLTEQQLATYSKMVDLVSLLPDLFIDTAGFILPDSVQSPILENLAETDHDVPGAWSRNILVASGLLEYEEPVFSGSSLKSSRKDSYNWTNSHSIGSYITLFPNPAWDYLIIECRNNENNPTGLIRIIDIHGRTLKSEYLNKEENQKIFQVNDLESGTYLLQFLLNGTVRETQKVVIVR